MIIVQIRVVVTYLIRLALNFPADAARIRLINEMTKNIENMALMLVNKPGKFSVLIMPPPR